MPNEPDLCILLEFPASTLRDFAQSLRGGSLRHGITAGLLQPFFGSKAPEVACRMSSISGLGCPPTVLAALAEALAKSQSSTEAALRSVFPVLSGPAVPGVPVVATPTVVRGLFEEAKSRVLISSYVFHDASELLAPLAKRMDCDPEFETTIITDLSHTRKNDEPIPVLTNRFKQQFLAYSWPGKRHPTLWHDPRALFEPDRSKSGVMHAKTVIIDEAAAFVTSANFTEAAQGRNVEAGILVRHPIHVKTLRAFFHGLIETNQLQKI
jgi:phosphatidylserine/phosphatidylglycerophosphate/cardiolipin synthase-like enzyme